MAISGSFKASSGYDVEAGRTRENWGTGVDPGHENPNLPDPGTPPPANPATVPEVPDYVEDYWRLDDPPDYPPADQEPAGHEGIATAAWGTPDMESQAANNRARLVSRGADNTRGATMVSRDWTQTYQAERAQSLPPAGGDPSWDGEARRALRGFNALAINNPGSPEVNGSGDYIRQGYELNWWTNRVVRRTGLTHTRRPIQLNLATVAKETQPLAPGDYSPYSSPYVSRARVVSGISTPVQRREPRPWDEDVTVDAAAGANADDADDYFSGGL